MRVKPSQIIKAVKQYQGQITVAAQDLGIHRSTVYRWIRRSRTYRNRLVVSVKRRSTRPHHPHQALLPVDKDRAVSLRRERGFTAEKIVASLGSTVPSRTVHRLLITRSLVRQYGYHRRPRFQNTIHMHAKKHLPSVTYRWM